MKKEVLLNDYSIKVKELDILHKNYLHVRLVFDVTHEMYHDVTTLLYENNFTVQIPTEKIAFQETISQYYTSITNLYNEDSVGEFTVELVEKAGEMN